MGWNIGSSVVAEILPRRSDAAVVRDARHRLARAARRRAVGLAGVVPRLAPATLDTRGEHAREPDLERRREVVEVVHLLPHSCSPSLRRRSMYSSGMVMARLSHCGITRSWLRNGRARMPA